MALVQALSFSLYLKRKLLLSNLCNVTRNCCEMMDITLPVLEEEAIHAISFVEIMVQASTNCAFLQFRR